MPFLLRVHKDKQIIVPVRFAPVIPVVTDEKEPAVRNSELDDRGFEMGTRPGTWAHTGSRGAMMSMVEGDTVKVKVLREDIDASAALFVTSTRPEVVAVTGAAGQTEPLGADGIFEIKGLKDLRSSGAQNFDVAIQVRLGARNGPVLGEMEPHVFQMHEMRVLAHRVAINSDANMTRRTPGEIGAIMESANKIWRAVGIRFLFNEKETRTDRISGFREPGAVIGEPEDGKAFKDQELSRLLHLNADQNAINIYFVQRVSGTVPGTVVLGVTHGASFVEEFGIGVVISDTAVDKRAPNVVAHELGHFLGLQHADEKNFKHVHDDIWAERHLMWFSDILLPSQLDENQRSTGMLQPAYRNDVGYGFLGAGVLIDVKNLDAEPEDGSVDVTRQRSLHRPISAPLIKI